jgi:hypothetical protein
MRQLLIIAATTGLCALAACGEGSAFDNSFRTSYREKAVESCTAGARAAIPAGVQVDVQRVCTCAVERHMEGKSATELMGNDDQPAAQAATEQCLREEMARVGGGGGSGAKPGG